jgi:hypothetical protein
MTDTNESSTPSEESAAERSGAASSNRRKKLLWFGVWVILALAIGFAGVSWLNSKAFTIKSELQASSALIPKLKTYVLDGNSAAAVTAVSELKSHTAKARENAADPLWTMAGGIPWLGANFRAVSTITTAADDVAQHGAAPLVEATQSLNWKSLTPNGQGMDLSPLTAAQPKLAAAANAVRQSSDRLGEIETGSLITEVSRPLSASRDQLISLGRGLDAAANAAKIIPSLMGGTSPKQYLLLVQNNAESRATGGIPGALAVLGVDGGKLSLNGQTSATAMGVANPRIPVEEEQQTIYSARIGKFMQDVNLTPDFPTSASAAVAMWKQKTNQALDGVISIDPVALGYILDATGPVKLTDLETQNSAFGELPTELNSKNVVPTLLSTVYSEIDEPELQDVYFAGVAHEVFGALAAGKADPSVLVSALSKAASERRVLLWSANADEQATISGYPLGGAISGSAVPPAQFGVYFNDGTGAKMDYYIKRTVQLVQECSTDGYGRVKVRVTSMNSAPRDAAVSLPEYVTGGGVFGVPPGTVQTNVVAYGPAQANIENAYIAGKKTGFASQRHAGRPVGTVTVRLAPGQSSTVEFSFGKIVQHTEPVVSVTPTVQTLNDVILKTQRTTCRPAS